MTTAQLKTTVFVKDPDTHQTIELHPGTCPEPHLAALVTNPSAWVDGKLPRLRLPQKPQADTDPPADPQEPPEGDDDGGDTSGADADSDAGSGDSSPATEEKPPARAAKKTTARKPPVETAAEGTGGQ
ncbi:hypothetical protein [Streptomyces sp. NPDC046371]|uniref:hypothetical protein n=1 Tax=Streptomyces sp. NPDC046371 TaxID=3154916 RepID=UPI0033C445AE